MAPWRVLVPLWEYFALRARATASRAGEPDGFAVTAGNAKRGTAFFLNAVPLFGDPYGNRTHVTTVKG